MISDDIGTTSQGEKEFHITDIRDQAGQSYSGKIRIRSRGDAELGRGDIVRVSGVLRETLGYSRQGSISSSEVLVLHRNDSLIEGLRAKFFATVSQLLNEPHASLGLGYLVGLRVSIPDDLDDKLSRTGLTHIVAVSGYNLTVIVAACRRLLSKRSAYQATILPFMLIIGFILIAGWSAPIARAAVISLLSLLAWYYGRSISPILLLLISGAITGLVTPLYVWGDVSWYLSFLAFIGVLLFAPLVTKKIYKDKEPSVAMQILIETVSAQLFALPYIMMLFGTASLIAPLANLLVLPPTPLIMLGIFSAGAAGLIFIPLAKMLIIFPYLLLTVQLWIIDKLSNVSWAAYEIKISISTMLAAYLLLAIITIILWHREKIRITKDRPTAQIDWSMVK